MNIVERTKSAIVLMRCLPCARAAVLEQIFEIFQEAVHKHIIESDRQDLLGKDDNDVQLFFLEISLVAPFLEPCPRHFGCDMESCDIHLIDAATSQPHTTVFHVET